MRGIIDGVLSRLFDLVWAYPAVLLGVALGVALGGRRDRPRPVHPAQRLAAAAGVRDRRSSFFPYVAKPLRAQALSLREREFVDAARVMGYPPPLAQCGSWSSEILPNLAV